MSKAELAYSLDRTIEHASVKLAKEESGGPERQESKNENITLSRSKPWGHQFVQNKKSSRVTLKIKRQFGGLGLFLCQISSEQRPWESWHRMFGLES